MGPDEVMDLVLHLLKNHPQVLDGAALDDLKVVRSSCFSAAAFQ
jgi:hypothetical protein